MNKLKKGNLAKYTLIAAIALSSLGLPKFSNASDSGKDSDNKNKIELTSNSVNPANLIYSSVTTSLDKDITNNIDKLLIGIEKHFLNGGTIEDLDKSVGYMQILSPRNGEDEVHKYINDVLSKNKDIFKHSNVKLKNKKDIDDIIKCSTLISDLSGEFNIPLEFSFNDSDNKFNKETVKIVGNLYKALYETGYFHSSEEENTESIDIKDFKHKKPNAKFNKNKVKLFKAGATLENNKIDTNMKLALKRTINFNKDLCQNFQDELKKEWLKKIKECEDLLKHGKFSEEQIAEYLTPAQEDEDNRIIVATIEISNTNPSIASSTNTLICTKHQDGEEICKHKEVESKRIEYATRIKEPLKDVIELYYKGEAKSSDELKRQFESKKENLDINYQISEEELQEVNPNKIKNAYKQAQARLKDKTQIIASTDIKEIDTPENAEQLALIGQDDKQK